MRRIIVENINAVVVIAGFVALECGVATHWSMSVASMVGGVVLMAAGVWPYLGARRNP